MSATGLVDSIIDAHGGLSRFSTLASITTHFQFTGATLGLKGRPERLLVRADVSTREQKVTYRGFSSSSDEEWVFTPGRVWKQSISSKTVLEARDNPRQAFEGHTLETPWDDFHFLYFSGYALWQYINFPYFLTRKDVTARELDPHVENGSKWRVLQVEFPPQDVFASHSAQQTYYFDDAFALRRHDYTPDVLGGSPAAHYSFDETEVGGLKFASLRRVVAKGPAHDGSIQPLLFGPIPTLILLTFSSISLNGENGDETGSWKLREVHGS